jgi:subtilisin family serine protease
MPGFSRLSCLAPGLLATCLFLWNGGSATVADSPADATRVLAAAESQQLHLSRLGALGWHQKEIRGQGVKVAILDSGFRGYRDLLGTVLPAKVTVRSFREDGDLEARASQHGLMCAEVLHAVAPDAELLLANWEPDQPLSFLRAVRWARDQGAKVISCSLIMPSWSDGEGGGLVNRCIAQIVGSGEDEGDVLFFASAGNTAQRHWTGSFAPDAGGHHRWSDGEIINHLKPWGNDRVAVELYGRSVARFALEVRDALTGESVGEAALLPLGEEPHEGNCVTIRFLPEANHTYKICLRCKDEPIQRDRDRFHLVVLGGWVRYYTRGGSITCPADGPAVSAVGAVDGHGQRCDYSSCGPNSPLPKPDFVAEVPFPSLWRDRPFSGTSAAAPQAAGLAALWWSAHRDWTAQRIKSAMQQSARDLGPEGHDWETGYGLLRAP